METVPPVEAWLSESTVVLTTWATLGKQDTPPPSLFLNPGLRSLAKGVDRRKDVSGFDSVEYHRCKGSLVGFT